MALQACRQVGGGCPELHPPTCRLLCRPPGHPVQNVLPRHNFHGTAEQDLPFCKGDVLTIVAVTKVTRDLTPPPITYLWVLLPCREGEPEKVSGLPSPQDPNWYKAKNKVGREGIIPANYVQKREGVKAGTKLSLMP